MEIDENFLISVNPNNFPGKLWNLVNDPQICSVCWDANGEGILIHQQDFETEVLMSNTGKINKYFKTTDFTSFIRQLNLYGFRKVRSDHDDSEKQLESSSIMSQPHHFHSLNFKRDKPELLVNLKRLTPVNRAKLAKGIQPTSLPPKRFHHMMLKLPQQNSAVVKNGSVLDEHRGTPCLHFNEHQLGKAWDETPKSSQAFLMGHGDPGPMTLYSNTAVPFSLYHHFLMDSPSAQGTVPHHSQYGFYTPVYQCCSPGFFDSKVLHSQLPATSYSHYGYHPDCSGSCFHPTDQNPDWKAGDAPDSWMGDMRVNLDNVFKDDIQVAADVREAAEVARHLGKQPE